MTTWTHYISELDAFEIYHQVRETAPQNTTTLISDFAPALGHALAGATGTAVSNIIVYPLDLVVTRLQVQAKKPNKTNDPEKAPQQDDQDSYSSLPDAFRKIYRNEGGITAFYSGISQDTAKSMLDSFIFFLSYNVLFRLVSQNRHTALDAKPHQNGDNAARLRFLKTIEEIGVGMAAGAITKGFTSPIQQVVTRKQTASGGKELSAREIAEDIYRARGLKGLWAGYSATILLTLNPSLTFFADSTLRRAIRAGENPRSVTTFLVAAIGKAIASTIMYPVSMAKARAQVSKESRGSVLGRIPEIAAAEGVTALYAGLAGEVINGFFKHGLTMMVKERVSGFIVRLWFIVNEMLRRLRLRS